MSVYLAYRVIWALFFLVIWIYDLLNENIKYLIYFTNWSYMMLTLCSVLECICAIHYLINSPRKKHKGMFTFSELLI